MSLDLKTNQKTVRLAFLILIMLYLSALACSSPIVTPEPEEGEPAGDVDAPKDEEPTEEHKIPTSIWSGDNGSWPSKPVRFANTGTVAYIVQPWTYRPLNDYNGPNIPEASTVVFTGGSNPSANLSLWLGTYTWCYYWDIGDTDGDGNINYQHAIDTRPVELSEEDSDDLENAELVILSAPPSSGILPGDCNFHGSTVIGWTVGEGTYLVEVSSGKVISGRTHGGFESWVATGGTYNGTTLYVTWKRAELNTSQCADKEEWYTTSGNLIILDKALACGSQTNGPTEYRRWR